MSNGNILGPLPAPQIKRGKQRLFIDGLVLSCNIGIFSHERTAPQRVRIDVMISRQEPAMPIDDSAANVIRYDVVIDRIKEIVSRGHINLVETLAERIAEMCCVEFPIEMVRVKVCKLDVFDDVASVGVELERFA